MAVHLFISAYHEKDKNRNDELQECLSNNIKSGCFDSIWIIAEDDGKDFEYLRSFPTDRVNILPCTNRPTFRTFFNAINTIDDKLKSAKKDFQIFGNHPQGITVRAEQSIGINMSIEEDVYIVSNADIYFDEIPVLPKANQCFALTRYERIKNGPIRFEGRKDSQDSFFFRGKVRIPAYSDFPNWPGCDNRIVWELNNVGYEMLNPSLTIKSYHIHDGPKSYTKDHRVNRPYMFLTPIELNQ